MPFQNNKVEFKLLKDISETIRDENDLINLNENFDDTLKNYDEKMNKLEKYIFNISDTKFSNIVLNSLNNYKNFGKNKDMFTGSFFIFLLKLRLLTKNYFVKKNISSFEKKSLQKLKPFNNVEIFELYKKLLIKYNISENKLQIKEIMPRLYLIKQNEKSYF